MNSTPNWLEPLLREYAFVLDFADKSTVPIMQSLYANFVATGKRVKSRQFSYGSLTAGATPSGNPVGDGTIYMISKDENGFDIENTYVQTITFECVADQNSGGVKFKESFRFRGGAAAIDNILLAGSDSDATYPGLSSDDSSAYFQNCSFSSMNGDVEETKFDFWTISDGDATLFTQDTADAFQVTPGDPVQACLDIATNGKIEQAFSLGNTQFGSSTPFIIRVPFKRNGANANSEIWLEIGEQVQKYVMTGAESGWKTDLVLELSDRAWYKHIAKNGGKLAVSVHGLNTGSIKVDNILVAPCIPFDGLWFASCAGATPFKKGDNYYRTITAVNDAILQRMFVQHTGVPLPAAVNASDITWPDPVAHT
jgi:hypothetical protein